MHFRNPYVIFIIALIIREIFAPWTGHPWDFELFARLGPYVLQGHNPYGIIPYSPQVSFWYYGQENMTSIAYPPLYAYYSAFSYFLYSLLNINDKYIYYLILKQPLVISDVFVGYFIYKKFENETDLAKLLSYSWLFNPYTILFSSIWGLPHSIAILFLVLAVINFQKQRSLLYLLLSSAFSGLPIIYLLPFFIYHINRNRVKFTIYFSLGLIIIALAFLIPLFFLHWNFLNIYNALSSAFFKESYGRFTYWFLITYLYELNINISVYMFYIASYFAPYLWAIFTFGFPIVWFYFSKVRDEFENLIACCLATTAIFLLTRNSVNEQYLLYLFIFAIFFYKYANRKYLSILFLVYINVWIFILFNNSFLLRFFTPINPNFYLWDILLSTSFPFMVIRETIVLITGTLNAFFMYKILTYLRSFYLMRNESFTSYSKILPFYRRRRKACT